MCLTGSFIEAAKLALLHILRPVDSLARTLRSRTPTIIVDREGAIAAGSSDRLCLFAHYDRDDLVDDYVVHYLKALHELGCEIVFISTAEGLGDDQLAKVAPYTRRILVRENTGHDFGSWKIGLRSVNDISRFHELIIANDSVYGPLYGLGALFSRMDTTDAHFWGLTDSLRYGRHLQSYFVVFKKSAFQSEAFSSFWENLPFYQFKHTVILRGEIGLSRTLLRAGFRLGAAVPYQRLRETRRDTVRTIERRHYRGCAANPVRSMWDILIRNFDFPFLKVELPRDNPLDDETLDQWSSVITTKSSYDVGLIRRHLDRIAKRPANPGIEV